MNCLVTGSSGLLGSAVVATIHKRGWDVRTLSRQQLDVSKAPTIFHAISAAPPDVLVNCAANMDIENAEADIDSSYTTNALLPGILASVCREYNVLLVHFSSTGCYGNWKDEPYTEFDPVRPTTLHHKSKVAGEGIVRESGCRSLILRTGWLYGGSILHKRNFVWQRLLEAKENSELLSDTSQRGNPTCVSDVAAQMLRLIEVGLTGTFNCVANGAATRFEYVSSIIRSAGLNCRVVAAPPGHFIRRAPVSPNEVAVNYSLNLLALNQMPDWNVALENYVHSLGSYLGQII